MSYISDSLNHIPQTPLDEEDIDNLLIEKIKQNNRTLGNNIIIKHNDLLPHKTKYIANQIDTQLKSTTEKNIDRLIDKENKKKYILNDELDDDQLYFNNKNLPITNLPITNSSKDNSSKDNSIKLFLLVLIIILCFNLLIKCMYAPQYVKKNTDNEQEKAD